jgi:hypothetical protein
MSKFPLDHFLTTSCASAILTKTDRGHLLSSVSLGKRCSPMLVVYTLGNVPAGGLPALPASSVS